ncbi:unnamed protein product [Vitrella brassicaformis CCMP3155]|uniref:Uncharacterized protein n=1 Tax=Vitrella brassicaformis (strain CCMP3155) TaxID=1169540 RepID=A0A0G4EKV3_VITBC|nr:unnamed protein product [Vitrella brassicaformis CCMP3155]|eukprot:CEL97347.1 unnamed protein product [Vitrella brassicaformis CCMP3155]
MPPPEMRMPSPLPAALLAAAAAAPVDLLTASAAKKNAALKEHKVAIAEEARQLIEGPRWRLESFLEEHHHWKREESRGLKEALRRAKASIEKLEERQERLVELAKERNSRIAALELELRAYSSGFGGDDDQQQQRRRQSTS